MRTLLGAVIALLAATGFGCSGGGTGTLAGTVEYKGRKLAQGTVNVVSDSGVAGSAAIQPDGTYRIENCPTGRLKISVFSPDPSLVAAANATRTAARLSRGRSEASVQAPVPGDPATWFEIPECFSRPDESGLICDVASGENFYPIKME